LEWIVDSSGYLTWNPAKSRPADATPLRTGDTVTVRRFLTGDPEYSKFDHKIVRMKHPNWLDPRALEIVGDAPPIESTSIRMVDESSPSTAAVPVQTGEESDRGSEGFFSLQWYYLQGVGEGLRNGAVGVGALVKGAVTHPVGTAQAMGKDIVERVQVTWGVLTTQEGKDAVADSIIRLGPKKSMEALGEAGGEMIVGEIVGKGMSRAPKAIGDLLKADEATTIFDNKIPGPNDGPKPPESAPAETSPAAQPPIESAPKSPTADLKSGKTPLKEFDIDRYGAFNTTRRLYDKLAGHEMLQNAWLKARGYAARRGTGSASRNNPAVALSDPVHDAVGVQQQLLGLTRKQI
jgi:hypothetical protein